MTAGDTTTRLRVAYLVNQYPKVSHSFIRREILALERQGVEVLRFAHRGWDAELVDPDDLQELEQTVFLLRQGWLSLLTATAALALTRPVAWIRSLAAAIRLMRRGQRGLVHHLAYFVQACLLLRHLQQGRAQHLHAHFGTNSATVAMLARMLGGPPFSFTVHGPEEFDKPESLALGEKANNAAFVVAISSFGRSQLWRWMPASQWNKVKVVHCGLDEGFLGATSDDAGLESTTLVCVGRLCEQKGQLLLIQALSRLIKEDVTVNLVLAGDGEMRPEVETAIQREDLSGRVRITGWISAQEVRQEIISARALVLPSFAEGLPVVIMEALALRRPVISTYVAGIPELIGPGEGWLVPAGDLDALINAMRTCVRAKSDELRQMGELGRSKVLDRHDVNIEAAKLVAHFKAANTD